MNAQRTVAAAVLIAALAGWVPLLGKDYTWRKTSKAPVYVYPLKVADGPVEVNWDPRSFIRIPLMEDQTSRNHPERHITIRVFKGSKKDLKSRDKNYQVEDCFEYCYTDYEANVDKALTVAVTVGNKWLSVAKNVRKWVDQPWVLVPIIKEKLAPGDSKAPDGHMLIHKDALEKFFSVGIEILVKPNDAPGPVSSGFSLVSLQSPIPRAYEPAIPQEHLPICYSRVLTALATGLGDLLVARAGACAPNAYYFPLPEVTGGPAPAAP